jgi:hypothetical protein
MKDELKIVPIPAWIIAALVYCGFVALLANVTGPGSDISRWPEACRWLFVFGIPLTLFVYVILIGYVNADARRRGMRYVMWTLLAIFVPNALGIILYFVLRDPLMFACPFCSAPMRGGFAFCPSCGASTAHSCPSCRKPVDPHWLHCVACGAKLT